MRDTVEALVKEVYADLEAGAVRPLRSRAQRRREKVEASL